MKKTSLLISRATTLVFACFTVFCSLSALAQTDTLHIYYQSTNTMPHDTSVAKIEKWAKNLKGQHVDVRVISYYNKLELKKFSDQRNEEMFLVLNRKARELITIVSMEAKKGTVSQRTTVDIIYKPTVTAAMLAEAEAKEKAEEAKKKEAANAEKAAKDKEKKETAAKNKEAAAATAAVAKAGDKDSGKDKKSGKEEKDEKAEAKEDKKGAKEKEGKETSDEEIDFGHVSTINKLNEGEVIELEDLKYIKRAKLIISQTGKKDVDENLFKAVTDFWTFSSNFTAMPYNEAEKLIKANKKDTLAIMSFAMVKAWHTIKSFGYEYRIFRLGYCVCIENSKGKIIYKQFIPIDKEKGTTLEYVAFGVSTINYFFNTMYELNLEKSTQLADALVESPKELKEKTLVISEKMIHPKFPVEEISKYYGGKVEIVSQEQWIDLILKKKNKVYVMITPIPTKSKNYYHYLVDASTGKVLLLDRGPSFQMAMSVGTSKNMDPSQSGFVDKSNFERYTEIINTVDEKAAKINEKADKKAKKNSKEKEETVKKEESKKDESSKEESKKEDKKKKSKKEDESSEKK